MLVLLCVFQFGSTQPSEIRVPLLREGTRIIEGIGKINLHTDGKPASILLSHESGTISDSFVLLPNQRFSEMEEANTEYPGVQFRVTGDVYAFGNQNYLLVREVSALTQYAEREHPAVIPIDPNAEAIQKEDFNDSIADIVEDLENAAGSLAQSIRSASAQPIRLSKVVEGTRISARRCHLVRNKQGGWVAIFVSDASGLQDAPCTILPSSSFGKLIKWARQQEPSNPVLLSGELLNYNGHGFLIISSWRPVHKTDHLDY